MKTGNPDKGPQMHTGEIRFDKGYVSDDEYFSPRGVYPGDAQRGNQYMPMQNEIARKDSAKLNRSRTTNTY